ncbi:MAG TPA: HAD-IIA family hydrolase [Clostridiales bacterium]|nr:MAG: putative hydrolase YutF [Firmicutes bacterium ADurb.Bin262]HOU09615.1 HAD-IIA family hydrolase [Clostridiales bacterium]HQK74125.1 HAD-IIA family hydrolase [Clostridiales bacterium]
MQNKEIFRKTRFFVLDMDGTFYLGDRLIDGAADFVDTLKASGKDYCFFSNNSSNNVESCLQKLERAGFKTTPDRIVISSHVAADYLNTRHPGQTVFLLGNEKLTADFIAAGIPLTLENPDVVVLGFDTTLTYEKIRAAAQYIQQGAFFIATHPDLNCPVEGGFIPDTGSMIELFAASTGKRPLVLGKPTAFTVDYLTKKLGCERDELAFVGDRLETDIAIGADHHIPCVLVLSGITTNEMYAASPIRADIVTPKLADLRKYL